MEMVSKLKEQQRKQKSGKIKITTLFFSVQSEGLTFHYRQYHFNTAILIQYELSIRIIIKNTPKAGHNNKVRGNKFTLVLEYA